MVCFAARGVGGGGRVGDIARHLHDRLCHLHHGRGHLVGFVLLLANTLTRFAGRGGHLLTGGTQLGGKVGNLANHVVQFVLHGMHARGELAKFILSMTRDVAGKVAISNLVHMGNE